MKKTPKAVKAWTVTNRFNGDFANRLFETKQEAIEASVDLPTFKYKVVQVLITPIKKQRRGK